MSSRQNVVVLGSTGSIGLSTLDVLARQKARYAVHAITANRNVELILEQCRVHEPQYAVMVEADAANQLRERLKGENLQTQILDGTAALEEVVASNDTDVIMSGIVGAAGLRPTFAAIGAGKKVLVANKEPVVMAGDLLLAKAQESGAWVIPVDSEHNAIMQCMPPGFDIVENRVSEGISRIFLTGSGGPFRDHPLDKFDSVTPVQACAHPNWEMGPKISVDSATMMNKALELIEASILFAMPSSRIDIIIHPQSIIHSMVEYHDGSVLAQMGMPDMRIPIASALAWPQRIDSGADKLDFHRLSGLEFEPPDTQRYPALALVRQVIASGGGATCVMNAANEVAVTAFLQGKLKFSRIVELIDNTLQQFEPEGMEDLESIVLTDSLARETARSCLNQHSG